jgi:hypothetical protein
MYRQRVEKPAAIPAAGLPQMPSTVTIPLCLSSLLIRWRQIEEEGLKRT